MSGTPVAFHWAGRLLLLAVLAITYAPVVLVFVYSLNASRLGSIWTGFSLRWYGELFRRTELWEGLWLSVVVGFFASSLAVSLGTLAALGLRHWRPRTRKIGMGFLGVPLVVPDMVLAVSLALLFFSFHVPQGLTTVILSHTAFGIAYAFVVLSAAVEDLDENLYLAALDCGATPWQAFWKVTVPILLPSLLVAWLLVFGLSFDDFLLTFFTKGPGNDTLPIRIYSQMRFGVRPDTNALFVVLFCLNILGVALAWWLGRRRIGRLS